MQPEASQTGFSRRTLVVAGTLLTILAVAMVISGLVMRRGDAALLR